MSGASLAIEVRVRPALDTGEWEVWARRALEDPAATDHTWRLVGHAATRRAAQEMAAHLRARAHAGHPPPDLTHPDAPLLPEAP